MTALMLRAISLVELVAPKIKALYPGSTRSLDALTGGRTEPPSTRSYSLSCTLELSEWRAHDSALDILRAYKLTGNFQVNLEIVLKHLGVFDEVMCEIESMALLPFHSDCRHVVFWPNKNVRKDRFNEIIRSINGQIGFDATLPWWRRLFR
jgi:hypothetical protein